MNLLAFLHLIFAVRLTNNFVVAGSHLENKGLAHVSLYKQLQTSWLHEHVQTVCLGRQMSYFILQVDRTNFTYQLSVELGFTSNNASKRTALSKQSGQHIEKETAVDEREVFQHFSFSKPIKSSMTSLDLHQHTSTRL